MKDIKLGILSLLVALLLFPGISGAQDKAVIDLQKALQNKGYAIGKLDGLWGKKTIQALKKFQADNKIGVSGLPDEKTLLRLGLKKKNMPDLSNVFLKINSVVVHAHRNSKIYGTVHMKGVRSSPRPPTIHIVREYVPVVVDEWGLDTGSAYLENEVGEFKFIRTVDLTLTDSQLSQQFLENYIP